MSRFQELQEHLRQHWQSLDAAANILVVPSLSLDQQEMRKIQGSLVLVNDTLNYAENNV